MPRWNSVGDMLGEGPGLDPAFQGSVRKRVVWSGDDQAVWAMQGRRGKSR